MWPHEVERGRERGSEEEEREARKKGEREEGGKEGERGREIFFSLAY